VRASLFVALLFCGAAQAAEALPAGFLEFLGMMIERDGEWIDPLHLKTDEMDGDKVGVDEVGVDKVGAEVEFPRTEIGDVEGARKLPEMPDIEYQSNTHRP
jgi:hypothetical protein